MKCKQMIDAFLTGNISEAAMLHQQLLPIIKGLFEAPSPAPVKTALQLIGMDVGLVRLPMVPLTEQERTTLAKLLGCNNACL